MSNPNASRATLPHDGHPLVATRALIEGRARPFPAEAGERQPTGEANPRALDRLMCIAEALFSTQGTPPPRERIAWLRGETGDFLSRASPIGRGLFVIGSLIVCWLAPLFVGGAPPLARLSFDKRVEALARFEARRVAPILIGLRAILCLLYYEHPDAAREVGIDPAGPAGGKLLEPGDLLPGGQR